MSVGQDSSYSGKMALHGNARLTGGLMSELTPWQFWIDRGGTFTDVIARCPNGELRCEKLLSDDSSHYADAAAEGIRRQLARWSAAGLPVLPIDAIKMGTTVATNALLQRRGARSALLVTQGFADSLLIAYQNRPDIFALDIRKPEPLYHMVREIDERVTAAGEVLQKPSPRQIRRVLQECLDAGIESLAICFMHGYRFPEHEALVASEARRMGFAHVSASHAVEPLQRFVSRAETTLANAYLDPVLEQYLHSLDVQLTVSGRPRRLQFMQSNGGLTDAGHLSGKDAILSGPAGGVVGMAETGRQAGFDRIIGFDMGGTSTDVAAYAGEFERSNDSEIAGVRLRSPIMKIHTVAAGGGSCLKFADNRFQVGPESAGAEPGPACYRRGGPLTLTDANVLLGRIPVAQFPAVFGPNADQPPDADVVEASFATLATEISRSVGRPVTAAEAAEGFVTVANETMANAIRKISIERGEDARDFVLNCFGGAAGQHACAVAAVLSMRKILIHPMAGLLSAYGMGLARVAAARQCSVDLPLNAQTVASLASAFAPLDRECTQQLEDQGVPPAQQQLTRQLGLRIAGSDTILLVNAQSLDAMGSAFRATHLERFGVDIEAGEIQVASLHVAATSEEPQIAAPRIAPGPLPPPHAMQTCRVDGAWRELPVFARSELCAGNVINGPAIIFDAGSTTFIDVHWRATVDASACVLLENVEQQTERIDARPLARADAVLLEVFNKLFMNIAEQMGVVLQNTARSVNIRERLDFSCALFDDAGRLIANAPHMPVHLGSMGDSVRSVISARSGQLQPGDAVMLNAPYQGGTHLPDITVVTPYFADGDAPLFYLASRAHHADIGGMTPGSMPADSRHIDEEGVLIDNVQLAAAGRLLRDETLHLLRAGKYPARNPAQNLADLRAQLAANQQGISQLGRAIQRWGLATLTAYMEFVRANAAESVRRLIDTLHDGDFDYELDNGDHIRVSISVDSQMRRACVDFSGTSAESGGNFNAPCAVTRAAVLYVFRSLIRESIPMNEGCLEPLEIRIPDRCLLNPGYPAAVVAGNVETSQCITDALLGALGALAASQGTMNNLSFGNDQYQYYETIAGGAGAGPGWHGADAVQTHMTNSRLTDPEVLESQFPVRVEAFAIRRGSGGAGRWHAGDGAVRQLRFTAAMQVSLLSGHRRIAPFGLAGGEPGAVGSNRLQRRDGSIETLGGVAATSVEPGDLLTIETPGGGGYGAER